MGIIQRLMSLLATGSLLLAAARLRHIAGTRWGTRRYLKLDLLRDLDLPGTCVA